MQISENENKNFKRFPKIKINSITPQDAYINREIYRNRVTRTEKFCWQVIYKNTEMLISCSRDIKDLIAGPLKDIYKYLEFVIEKDRHFLSSIGPVKIGSYYPAVIKKMCRLSSGYDVGPMAAVAGTVNEYIASRIGTTSGNLIIENGGDLFIRSDHDVRTGLYIKNPFFGSMLTLKIKATSTPCGICSSSGTFGHSFSRGRCDLAVVLSDSAIIADAAATAVANSVKKVTDIEKAINKYKTFNDVKGILIVKDKKIGIWGKFELEAQKLH